MKTSCATEEGGREKKREEEGGRKEKRKGQRKRERGGGRTRGQKNGHFYFIENISQSDEFEGSNIGGFQLRRDFKVH